MSTITYLFLAVLTYIVYKIHKAFVVPKHLNGVQKVPLIPYLKAIISGESFDIRHEKLFKPALAQNGIARIWQQGEWELLVSDTKTVKTIFTKTDTFLKVNEEDNIREKVLLGKFSGVKNIVSSDGDEWKSHRRAINSAFKKTWDTNLFGKSAMELIDAITETGNNGNESVVINHWLHSMALDVLGRGLFSYDFKAVTNDGKDPNLKLYNDITTDLFNPLYFIFPFLDGILPSRKKSALQITQFRNFLLGIIEKKKEDLRKGLEKDDLVTLLVKSSLDDKDQSLSDDDVVNDLAAFFVAGHDTTANTLSSILYFLAKHKDIQDKARSEVINLLGDKPEVIIPDNDQQKEMPYINCIIKESMRIITTVPMLRRFCAKETKLPNGITIPKGSYVSMDMWDYHHKNEAFDDAETFRPDRFEEQFNNENNVWQPFGGGTRICVGMSFSLIEQRVLLSTILQKFTIELGSNIKSLDRAELNSSGFVFTKDLDLKFIPRY